MIKKLYCENFKDFNSEWNKFYCNSNCNECEYTKHVFKGQKLYYKLLGTFEITHCFDIKIKNNERYIVANNGVERKEKDVINNKCDLFTNKDIINKILSQEHCSKMVKDDD